MGNCLNFDGTSTAWISPSQAAGDAFDYLGQISVEFWFKPHSLGITNLLYREGSINLYFCEVGQGILSAYLGGTVNEWHGFYNQQLSTTDVWYYVALTYDGSAMALYVNGSFVESTAASGNTGEGLWEPLVGLPGYPGNYALCEYRISNTARTSTEVGSAWNGGSGRKFEADASTIILWHSDEGTGNPQDSSANGFHVTTRGAGVTWTTGSPDFPGVSPIWRRVGAGTGTGIGAGVA